jgi:hypothetical protein
MDEPGLEFFAKTGEYEEESAWQNPNAKWFHQVLPSGIQINSQHQEN